MHFFNTAIKHFTDYLIKYHDFFDIVISFGSLVATILLFYFGAKKLDQFYSEYIKRKSHALFSFYTQFDSLLIGIDNLITDATTPNQKKPADILNYIWLDPSLGLRSACDVTDDDIRQLNSNVNEFLHFFNNASDQIPPSLDKIEFSNWLDKKRDFIIELNSILIATKLANAKRGGSYDDKEVVNRYIKISSIIDYFNGIINKEYENYRTKAAEESLQ